MRTKGSGRKHSGNRSVVAHRISAATLSKGHLRDRRSADQLHDLSAGIEAHVLITTAARRVYARQKPLADGIIPVSSQLGEIHKILDVYLSQTNVKDSRESGSFKEQIQGRVIS